MVYVVDNVKESKEKEEIKNHRKNHRERVRRKFEKDDGESFESYELLEMFLFFCVPQKDTKKTAKDLINEFGSLAGVFDAKSSDLLKFEGITKNNVSLFKLMLTISRQYNKDKVEHFKNDVFDTIDKVGEYVESWFYGRTEECFCVILFDNALKLKTCVQLNTGGTSEVLMDTRKIIELILKHNASAVAIAHNHPSGILKPSVNDMQATNNLNMSLELIGVRFIEHIIVSPLGYIGIFESGYLTR